MEKLHLILGITCLFFGSLWAAPPIKATLQKTAPAGGLNPSEVQIVRYESDHDDLDNYHFNYALSDDQTRDEVGTIKDGKDVEGNNVRFIVVQGSYSFVGDDGQTHWVHYTADETGYHPRLGTGPEPERRSV
ncbi:endocuticle structural glycoprotein SgAbd-5-like [Topomyia yanbarensis]|uniref:endocuticle structural glycoprotein SgAbd-5-like n=1 Tax=Topomyia yanbarensis TaxID=2498891 RepID=UPI00273BDA1A|nr:endocuticle structural glycoprotein SgAbd-5-like [Topomyia yanbarensis]